MNLLIPLILLGASAALFFGFIDPRFSDVRLAQEEEARYDEALTRSRELQAVRDQLIARYNSFLQADVTRLTKLIPDHVDNVRLILDLDSIAARYGMRLRNVTIETPQERSVRGQVGPEESAHASLIISFGVSGTYDTFQSFLADLERSLRLVDVTDISFTSSENGVYNYSLSLKTYWLTP